MATKYTVNTVSREFIISSIESVDLNKDTPEDEAHRKAELDAQRALDETGFGKFNYKIIVVSGMMCMNVAFAITSVGFLLPSAACDFDMNTFDKGRLSASPIFGMLLGSCIWGCIADTKGRRTALLNCLFLQAIFECFASVVSNYWGFIVFKFLSGLALSGQMAVLYTYVGEFQPANQREKALSLMEIPWVIGTILAPIIAWITIPLEINLTLARFSFRSWNLYAAMCSVPAFVVGFLLLRLPETPKYLAETARYGELRNVLINMYRDNTGNTTEEYIANLDTAGIKFFTDQINTSLSKSGEKKKSTLDALRQFFVTLYEQTALLLKPPYLGRTVITCLGSYCIFSSLYTLMLWFPELFHRFAEFEDKHPGERASVCIVSQSISLRNYKNETFVNSSLPIDQTKTDTVAENTCDSTIGTQVYVYTLILASSCIPVAVIFTVCASRLGFRFYLVFNSFGCCAVTIGLIFVTTSTQNLILSCIYEALMSVCVTVIFCISVELFPTNLRVTGSALASFCGRIGALVGNTMFGYLIDDHCFVLISIVGIELFLAGVLGFFISGDNNGEAESGDKHKLQVPTNELPDSGSEKYSSSYANNSTLY
ncbi:synaptic vesicle glycoprotein 2B-like isoform X2 [Venturia canescens]|uniref:synaptic vesicle glycoprotein 2B-like isoform X2 n=1 Tax=Venturia canescens TaxID=32260 RepID=UPI001C9BC446|nr:synaptic vesicle glycoprotein 2B-like isoform X2 [Venturia canescens]